MSENVPVTAAPPAPPTPPPAPAPAAETPATHAPVVQAPSTPAVEPVAIPAPPASEGQAVTANDVALASSPAAAEAPSPSGPQAETPRSFAPLAAAARYDLLRMLVRHAIFPDEQRPITVLVADVTRDLLDKSAAEPLARELTRIVTLVAPAETDSADWATLAKSIHALHRQFFANAQPIDQDVNEALHNLGQTIAGPSLLGTLAQRFERERMRVAGARPFEEILATVADGHQTQELAAIKVPLPAVLPLVVAIAEARRQLAAKAQIDPLPL